MNIFGVAGGAVRAHGRDDAREKRTERGQARADDAGGEFGNGPAGRVDVVPGGVVTELEILNADDGDGAGLKRGNKVLVTDNWVQMAGYQEGECSQRNQDRRRR